MSTSQENILLDPASAKGSLHGFKSWIDFLKALLSVGGTMAVLLYILLTVSLDGRYLQISAFNQTVQGMAMERNNDRIEDLETEIAVLKFEMDLTTEADDKRILANKLVLLKNRLNKAIRKREDLKTQVNQ